MIAIIEVARHFLFLWRPALLPPLRRAGTESHGGQGQAASFITQVIIIISFSTCDQSKFQVSLAVFNKLGAEDKDITFLCLINPKVSSQTRHKRLFKGLEGKLFLQFFKELG